MSERFVSREKQTPEFKAAVVALRHMIEVDQAGNLDRAFAEATSTYYRELWEKARGVKRSGGHPCIQRLLGKRCTYSESDCQPPATDHPSLWNKNGKPVDFVSQPYGLSLENLREIITFCDKHNLRVNIRSWPSWHFPTQVLTVVFGKRSKPEQRLPPT